MVCARRSVSIILYTTAVGRRGEGWPTGGGVKSDSAHAPRGIDLYRRLFRRAFRRDSVPSSTAATPFSSPRPVSTDYTTEPDEADITQRHDNTRVHQTAAASALFFRRLQRIQRRHRRSSADRGGAGRFRYTYFLFSYFFFCSGRIQIISLSRDRPRTRRPYI